MYKTMTAMLGILKVNEVELGELGKLMQVQYTKERTYGRGVCN